MNNFNSKTDVKLTILQVCINGTPLCDVFFGTPYFAAHFVVVAVAVAVAVVAGVAVASVLVAIAVAVVIAVGVASAGVVAGAGAGAGDDAVDDAAAVAAAAVVVVVAAVIVVDDDDDDEQHCSGRRGFHNSRVSSDVQVRDCKYNPTGSGILIFKGG